MRLKAEGFGIRAIARSLRMPASSVHSIVKYEKLGWKAMKESVAEASRA